MRGCLLLCSVSVLFVVQAVEHTNTQLAMAKAVLAAYGRPCCKHTRIWLSAVVSECMYIHWGGQRLVYSLRGPIRRILLLRVLMLDARRCFAVGSAAAVVLKRGVRAAVQTHMCTCMPSGDTVLAHLWHV